MKAKVPCHGMAWWVWVGVIIYGLLFAVNGYAAPLENLSESWYGGGTSAEAFFLSPETGVLGNDWRWDASGGVYANTDLILRNQDLPLPKGKFAFRGQGVGVWGDRENGRGVNGYGFGMGGVNAGIEYALQESVTIGGGVGYAAIDMNQDSLTTYQDINSLSVFGYGIYYLKRSYAAISLAYNRNRYESRRYAWVNPNLYRIEGDFDGDGLCLSLSGAHQIRKKTFILSPYGALHFARLTEGAYQETGARLLNRSVPERSTDALMAELGLRAAKTIERNHFKIIPEIRLAFQYDFDLDDRIIMTQHMGFPGAAFSVPGDPVKNAGWIAGLNLALHHETGLSASLGYVGEFRDGYTAHGVLGQIQVLLPR